MTNTLILLLIAFQFVNCSTMAFADEDEVAKRLESAKTKFEDDSAAFEAMVLSWFDDQEDRARKTGKKASVDLVIANRDAYRTKNVLPEVLSRSIFRKMTDAEQKMVFAYERAISDYVKQKEDLLASQTQDELKKFKENPNAPDTRKVWRHSKGYFEIIDGETWEELSGNGKQYRYKENSRNKEYVEIDALNGNTSIRVRLYADHCDYGKKSGDGFTTMFHGAWTKDTGRTK